MRIRIQNIHLRFPVFASLTLAATLAVLAGCSAIPGKTDTASNAAAPANVETSGTPSGAGGQAAMPAPETLVSDLYKAHDAKKSPFFQTKDRGLVDKYFVKTLADLIWNDAKTSAANNDVGMIDADPLYDSQDPGTIKNFSVGKGEVHGDKATVPVSFTSYNEKRTIRFMLEAAGDNWKIANIDYGTDGSLMSWLKPAKTTGDNGPASNGEFAGKYRVGETTCTVTPVKMGFQVRWAKGSGFEFFGPGSEDFSFDSRDKSGAINSFVFDNARFDTGRFDRSDGKTFDVQRIQ